MASQTYVHHAKLTEWQKFDASMLVVFGGTVADEDTAAYAAHLAYASSATPGHERGTAIIFTGSGYTYYRLGRSEGIGNPNFAFGAIAARGVIVAYWHSHGDVAPVGEILSMGLHAQAVQELGKAIYTSFTSSGQPENLWVEDRTESGVRGQLISGDYQLERADYTCTLCEPFKT